MEIKSTYELPSKSYDIIYRDFDKGSKEPGIEKVSAAPAIICLPMMSPSSFYAKKQRRGPPVG